jgi:hypothetical protein
VSGWAYPLVAVAVAAVASTVLWFAQRKPTSRFSGIDEFRREMDALGQRPGRSAAPAGRAARRRRPEPIVPAPRSGDLARKLRAARQQRER